MFIEYGNTLIMVDKIGSIDITESVDKYNSKTYNVNVRSTTGDIMTSFPTKTKESRDTIFEQLKELLVKTNCK